MVDIKGTLPLDFIEFNAQPLDLKIDGDEVGMSTKKYEITLRIRGVDFRGRRCETYWSLFQTYIRKGGGEALRQLPGGPETQVFAAKATSTDPFWMTIPEAIRNGIVRTSPTPTPPPRPP